MTAPIIVRALALSVGASLLALTACTGGTDDTDASPTSKSPPLSVPSHLSGQVTEPTTAPAGPSALRWVGMDGVVVAVPESWGTSVAPCAAPDGDTVWFMGVLSMRIDCAPQPIDGVSSLTITSTRLSGLSLHRLADHDSTIHGLNVSSSDAICRNAAITVCSVTFTASGSDAVFRVVSQADQPRAFVLAVRDSIRRVPSGRTMVPFIEYGTSVVKAKQQLTDAGLRGQSPGVAFPHSTTGTDPPAGSVVAFGQPVELNVGDG